MAEDYDEKGLDEVLKRGQEALDRFREARSSRKRSTELPQDDVIEDLRKQSAERFALNQRIKADVHDLFMKVVSSGLEKQHDSEVPASSDVPTTQVKIASKTGDLEHQIPEFTNRALWLKDRMLERGWSNTDSSKYRGPDRKTIEKILRGEAVRNDILEKLADALSHRYAKVSVLDIPQS